MVDTHEIKRDPYMDNAKLAEHIRCVGQAIINDAESVVLKDTNVISIVILAVISPGDRVTRINYNIDRYSDPRIPDEQSDQK